MHDGVVKLFLQKVKTQLGLLFLRTYRSEEHLCVCTPQNKSKKNRMNDDDSFIDIIIIINLANEILIDSLLDRYNIIEKYKLTNR